MYYLLNIYKCYIKVEIKVNFKLRINTFCNIKKKLKKLRGRKREIPYFGRIISIKINRVTPPEGESFYHEADKQKLYALGSYF